MTEIEFKWKIQSRKDFDRFLNAAKSLGAKIGREKCLQIQDLYWDTEDDFFASQGIKSRLRRVGNKWEWTLKSRSKLKGGLAKRQEKNIPLPRFKTEAEAISFLSSPRKRGSIDGAMDSRFRGNDTKIKELFRVKNLRTVRKLTLKDGTTAEASYDDVFLIRGKRKIKLREIELEYLKGSLKTFHAFCREITQHTNLTPAKTSKVATAHALFFKE